MATTQVRTDTRLRPGLRVVLGASVIGWTVFAAYLLLSANPPMFEQSDKLQHAMLFVGVGWSALALCFNGLLPKRAAWTVAIATLVLAPSTEIAQALFTPARSGNPGDALADVAGVVVAGLLLLAANAIFGPRAPIVHAVAACVSLVVAVLVVSPTGAALLERDVSCAALNTAAVSPDGPTIVFDGGTVRTADGEESVTPPVVLQTANGPLCAAMRAGSFTVLATVQSADEAQTGPARLVTSSVGTEPDEVNFHLGQWADSLSVRIRTGSGLAVAMDEQRIPGVFVDTRPHDITLRYDAGAVTVRVDRVEVAQYDIRSASLGEWRLDYPLLVGDELTLDRTFDGEVSRFSFYSRALSDGELEVLGG